MIEFLSHFSCPTVALIMVALFVGYALVTLLIVRRFLKRFLFNEMAEYAETFADAIGVIYALILALVVVSVWENYDKVEGTVEKEANSLHNIYRYLQVYPEPIRSEAQEALRQYVQRIVQHEWPRLSKGEQDDTAHEILARINNIILAHKPADNGELVLHLETVRNLSEYRGLRHDRIKGGKPCIGEPMWITLLAGTVVYLSFLCFFEVPCLTRHAIMLGMLAATLGLAFFLLVIYNYPFTEPAAVDSEPFAKLVEYWKVDIGPTK